MHDAWLIEDIQQLVLDHLDQQDLARLARTCKPIFEFAINRLWRKLTSVQPILCCLPEDTKTRVLIPSDLVRLYFYASKIQIVHLEGTLDHPITIPKLFPKSKKRAKATYRVPWTRFCEELAAARQGKSYMPNLRRFYVNNVIEEVLLPFIGVSAANLEIFYIKYTQHRQPESTAHKILENFEETPKLEYIYVRNGGPDMIPMRIIEQSPLKRLRFAAKMTDRGFIGCPQYENYTIKPEIFKKDTIENFSVSLSHDWCPAEINASAEKYFPSLRSLWLDLIPFTFGIPVCECRNQDEMRNHGWACTRNRNKPIAQARSPVAFFEGMDNPEIHELIIKFNVQSTSGSMFLEVVNAAKENCRLQNLTELALAGGGYVEHCWECAKHPDPMILPQDLMSAIKMLLPLPRLRKLRLSAAPNFLGTGEPELSVYEEIAEGLPSLEILWLGSGTFFTCSQFHGIQCTEKVPLRSLTAFCSLLPKLVEVEVGTVDLSGLDQGRQEFWLSPQVRILKIGHWIGAGTLVKEQLLGFLELGFPNCDLVEERLANAYIRVGTSGWS
jgi:hypothetical protein